MKPSPQQQVYYDWLQHGTGSAIVKAVAGSGKTSALVTGLDYMSGRIFFGAYNKKIAVEIQERAGRRKDLYVSTFHAAGFGAWRRVAQDVRVENYKCRDIFREMVKQSTSATDVASFESPVLNLVSYAKQAAVGIGNDRAIISGRFWLDLIDHFDVDTLGCDDLVLHLARDVLQRSIATDHLVIDFDDMIYAPLIHNARIYDYDWVLVDEAQDTNASRRALALRMLRRGGRLVAVGDPHQAIYGFTGADSDSLELIAKAVSAIDLPLTVSFRCPRSVVFHARQFVSHIEAHNDAAQGEVAVIPAGVTLAQVAHPGDAVLCRFNAPLIMYAYQFIAAGIPAKVEGREVGEGLKQLARRWRVTSYTQLLDRLDGYVERETAKYRAKEQESRAVAVEDKAECLRTLIARIARTDPRPSNAVQRLCQEIDSIFGADVGADCVLLSTIHKSKGREWNRVFWLQTGPSKWARKDWELEQENNLCYVATTRAKQSLFLVEMA